MSYGVRDSIPSLMRVQFEIWYLGHDCYDFSNSVNEMGFAE